MKFGYLRRSSLIYTPPSQNVDLAKVKFLYQLRRYNSTILCKGENLALVKHWWLLKYIVVLCEKDYPKVIVTEVFCQDWRDNQELVKHLYLTKANEKLSSVKNQCSVLIMI